MCMYVCIYIYIYIHIYMYYYSITATKYSCYTAFSAFVLAFRSLAATARPPSQPLSAQARRPALLSPELLVLLLLLLLLLLLFVLFIIFIVSFIVCLIVRIIIIIINIIIDNIFCFPASLTSEKGEVLLRGVGTLRYLMVLSENSA